MTFTKVPGPHLAVDVPVEAGCGEAVGGAAVGGQLLARAVQGQRAADHRALVRQVLKYSLEKFCHTNIKQQMYLNKCR